MIVRVVVVMVIVIVIVIVLRVVGHIVVMEAEEAFDEEHRQHAGEERDRDPANGYGAGGICRLRFRGIGGSIDHCGFGGRGGIEEGVRQHVEHADAEHHAGDEADGELHPAVRELKPDRDHAADDRRDEDQCAIIGEQDGGHDVERCRMLDVRTAGMNPDRSLDVSSIQHPLVVRQ